jgi:hypothetical protein
MTDYTMTKYFDNRVVHLRLALAPQWTWCKRPVAVVAFTTTDPATYTCKQCWLTLQQLHRPRRRNT